MASIATATVDIDANTVKFVNELKKAEQRSKRFGNSAGRNIRKVGTALRTISTGAVVAVAGFAAVIKASADASDQLVKTSDKLGITTKALSGLRLAAERSGVAQNQLDIGLQRMTRRVAEAAQGTGEAQGALRELGLDAEKLNQLPLEQQFQAISEAMNRVDGEAEKVRLSFKLFDSEGVALKNTLALGAARLRETQEEATALGLSLNNIQAKNIAEAGDAAATLDAAFTGLGRQLSAAFAPALTVASERLAGWVQTVTQALPYLSALASRFLDVRREVTALTSVEIKAEQLQLQKEQADNFERLGRAIDRIGNSTGRPAEANNRLIKSLNNDIAETGQRLVDLGLQLEKLNATPSLEIETPSAVGNFESLSDLADVSLKPIDNSVFEQGVRDRMEIALRYAQEQANGELAIQKAFDQAKLEDRVVTDAKILELAAAQAAAIVNAEFAAKQAALGEIGEPLNDEDRVARQQALGDKTIEIAKEIAAKRARVAAEEAAMLQKYDIQTFKGKANVLNATLGLAAGFNKKSQKLQQAALIASKAVAIKDSVIAIAGGVAKALNNPYPANLAFAAQVAAQGATLLSTISSVAVGGGGGGGSFGSPGSSVGASTPSVGSDEISNERESQASVQVIIQGNFVGDDENMERLIRNIREAVEDRDLVLINSDSRNAEDLLAGV